MKVKKTFDYKGRFAAELENGYYVLSNGSMELMLCEQVEEGMKVLKTGIIGGMMMRNEKDFLWCVEHTNDSEFKVTDEYCEEKDVEDTEKEYCFTFTSKIYIKAKDPDEARSKFEEFPLYSADALDHFVEYVDDEIEEVA